MKRIYSKHLIPISIMALFILACKETQKKETITEKAQVPKERMNLAADALTDLKIMPIAHATAVLQWKDLTIFIDPVGGSETFAPYGKPDLILITDIHGDHLDLETLKGLDTSKAKIIVPPAVAEKLPQEFTPQLDILGNGETKERYAITIAAVPMYNLREEAKDFHVKGRGNGYILNMGGMRIYFSGDTEDIPEMRSLKDIDKAFVCMNLPYTMTVESAASAVLEFKPKAVYPYHYRGRPDVSDVSRFKTLVNQGDPNIKVVQLDWYPNDEF